MELSLCTGRAAAAYHGAWRCLNVIGEICICALASAGILLVIWALTASLLLPAQEDFVVLSARGDAGALEMRVRSYRFLRDSGLLQAELVVVDCGLTARGRAAAERLCAPGSGAALYSRREAAELFGLGEES